MKTLHTDRHHIECWQCPYALQDGKLEIVVQAWVKRPGGLAYRVLRYPGTEDTPLNLPLVIEHTIADHVTRRADGRVERRTNLSPRPYRLGQSCDGSINDCVLALYFAFCQSARQDPTRLMAEAYPDQEPYTQDNWNQIQDLANWQGVRYPGQWNLRARRGLLESISEINYHQLNGLLIERKLLPSP
jgi:hypothetical protein